MASPRQSGRTTSTPNNSYSTLCQFTFSDGRKCRTPRTNNHPHFCFSHARKESQTFAVEKLSRDLTYLFSGDYLSANDLSGALGRLFPAVVRGDIKPRSARTLTYLAQTIVQSIHLAQHEYINAFGSDYWRETISHGVTENDHHFHPNRPDSSAPTQANVPPLLDSPVASEPNVHPEASQACEHSAEVDVSDHAEETEISETPPARIQ